MQTELTSTEIQILVLIRKANSTGSPIGVRKLADLLKLPSSTVFNHFNEGRAFVDEGLVDWVVGKDNTCKLTSQGQSAINDIVYARIDGKPELFRYQEVHPRPVDVDIELCPHVEGNEFCMDCVKQF